jgi:hypothetical protein
MRSACWIPLAFTLAFWTQASRAWARGLRRNWLSRATGVVPWVMRARPARPFPLNCASTSTSSSSSCASVMAVRAVDPAP